jgi:hypothetical protein
MKTPKSSTFNPLLKKLIQERKSFISVGVPNQLNEIEQVNTESGRYYKAPSGNLYPSVTTVTGLMTKDAIMSWRRSVGEEKANEISRQASSRGTRVHQLCEDYLNNSPIDPDKYTLNDAINFEKLKQELDTNLDNIRLQETRMYSDFLKMAGTVDCIADWDGKLSVIDFKTARKRKERDYIEHYFCQATAYAIMYEELFGVPITRLVIAISVDDDDPQIFLSKRDSHVDKLLEVREKYRLQTGV